MQKITRYGFLFMALFALWPAAAYCAEDVSLEPIRVSKEKVHLLKGFSVSGKSFSILPVDSAIEVLGTLPVDLQSRSPKAAIQTDFSLRGSNFQGVLMLLDGQRINDPQTGHHNADIPVTQADIERVEVLGGVSSSVFGPDAIGGAINFIHKKPASRKIIFESSGGQYKTWSGLFSAADKIGKLGGRVSVENQSSGGFYTDTDFRKFTSTIDTRLDVPDGEFALNFGYQEKEFGAYDFYTPASGYQSKEWTKTFLLNTGLQIEKAGFLIKPNFLWRRHYDKFMLDKTLQRSRYLNHTRTNMFTPNVYLQKEISLLGKVGLGLEYGQEKMNSVFLGKHSRIHKSVFFDDSKDINERLSLGLSFRTDDYPGSKNNYTGSLNSKYNISEASALRLGVGRSIRVPSFTELYYNDPTTVGNAALANESALNYQAGYDYTKEGLFSGITFFLRDETDSIDWVKSSPAQARWQAQNIGKAKVFGLESRLKFDLNQYLALDSNYTYINRRMDSQGHLYKYGPNYAKHIFNSELVVALPFGKQTIGLSYKKKPLRDGWLLLNAAFSYNLNKKTQLFLKGTNLCNVEYQEIEGIPQPGRWVEGGFRVEW